MHYEFDEKIDKSIEKSVRSTLRLFKEQLKQSREGGTALTPPSYDAFMSTVEEFMQSMKGADLNKLRTPSLRELFERAWAQKLRNYATQKQMRDAYDALMRKF